MRSQVWILVAALCLTVGCARTQLDTAGFESVDSATVSAGFEETWQATKAVLREMKLEVYTRDKRGEFVALSQMQRRYRVLTPQRAMLTIRIEEVSAESTAVTVETVQQVYGVTPLTYPDWHERGTPDNALAVAILDALRNRIG